ncbi:hypothetical protein M8J75_007073 [Diaphorina citri]|nr:hypothetical protein M8J75_007073 [Diaphorina citri]
MAGLSPSERRLQKELMSLMKEPPPGMEVDSDKAEQNLNLWTIHMKGAEGTLYDGEEFQLQFKFGPKYPFDSPEVTFVGNNIPVHPHVYSNGHICLSILTGGLMTPVVTFVGNNIPVHPHVYSNGHICLSILTDDWSPALSVQSVCLSIVSMLSSCKEKKRPPDNTFYVRTCNKNPKKTKWWYHDDSV